MFSCWYVKMFLFRTNFFSTKMHFPQHWRTFTSYPTKVSGTCLLVRTVHSRHPYFESFLHFPSFIPDFSLPLPIFVWNLFRARKGNFLFGVKTCIQMFYLFSRLNLDFSFMLPDIEMCIFQTQKREKPTKFKMI